MSMSENNRSEYGVIPKNWEIKPLNEISEKITDGSHFSPKPQSNGKYMCSVKDMTYNGFDFSNCKRISQDDFDQLVQQDCRPEKNDLLISKDGANCLDLIFIYNQDEDIVLLSSIALVRLKNNICPKYLRYFLLSPSCQFLMKNNFISGSAIPRVVLRDFKNVPIIIPPLPEQKAISAVLSSLDDKIDLLQRQNKTLEEMAQTLFRQWFIEEAQVEWEEKELNWFGDIVCGKTPSKKQEDYFYGSIPFIKIPDMHGNTFIFDTTDSLTLKGKNSQAKKTLPAKSICVSCIATVGLVSMNAFESQTNQQINSIIPNKEIYRYYLYLVMNNLKEELAALASGGTATLNLNTGNFSRIMILYPQDKKLENFHNLVKPLFEKIFANQTQIRTLETLRDTLLPKLMSGEVRVRYEQLPAQIEAKQPIAIEPFFPWLKNEWLAILEVVYRISKQPYANPIGQTIFQKVSYVITEETGLPLRLDFAQGDFGPYSKQISPVLKKLSQEKMIQKQSLGKMDEILLTQEFEQQREKFLPYLTQFEENIQKTVDLFCRIKNTEQAEEVATILYSARQLKNNHPKLNISEQQVLDYVLDWKPKWQEASKLEAVGSAIRNLGGLGWLHLEYSESLPEEPLYSV